MSRIGKQPIVIPKDVKLSLEHGFCTVEHGKNKLQLSIPAGISLKLEGDTAVVERANDEKETKSLHGTIRVLINNMVVGVTKGFKKELDIVGVGYKAQVKGEVLVLNIGFSHPVEIPIPSDLKVTTPLQTKIAIEGIDRQKVGEFAANVRRIYPPEPYKGKGIRYSGEEVRKKLGKALAK